jgi:hypothetical protein
MTQSLRAVHFSHYATTRAHDQTDQRARDRGVWTHPDDLIGDRCFIMRDAGAERDRVPAFLAGFILVAAGEGGYTDRSTRAYADIVSA